MEYTYTKIIAEFFHKYKIFVKKLIPGMNYYF